MTGTEREQVADHIARVKACARLRTVLLSTTVLTAAVLLPRAEAFAACAPAAGAGTPPSGTTVSCTGTTTDQNAPHGYGDGSQVGLTINVVTGASVTGTGTGGSGLQLNSGNTINNDGTVTGRTVGVNLGSNNTLNNTGLITAVNVPSSGVQFGNNTTNNVLNNSGTIRANGRGVGAHEFTLVNTGTIETNLFSVNADGVFVGGRADIRNFGTISANATGIFFFNSLGIPGGNTIFNAGTITPFAQGPGGTLQPGSIFPAIRFGGDNNTLTLAPTSVINGLVTNTTTTNTLQLGGTGIGAFDLSELGPNTGAVLGAPKYQGFSTFNKIDGSTWALNGTGAQTWNVNGGTLLVNGTIGGAVVNSGGTLLANGTVGATTVNSGGTVGGTGTLGNTTINAGGTISPGNSIGVLNVDGNLTFNPGSNYLVEVTPASADRINVSGVADLAGTVTAMFSGAFAAGGCGVSNSYTILSAGQRNGTFTSLNTVGMPGFLSANLSYTATEALLVTLSSNVQVIGNTPNQKAVAGAIDARFAGGCGTFPGFANLTPAQIPSVLDQLSGEVHPSTAGVLADESLYVRSAVLGRLRQASYGGDSQMASLALGGPQAFADGEEVSALAYGKSPIVNKAAPMTSRPGYDVVFWAQGLGARGKFDSDGNATNARRDLAGFFTGVDSRAGANGRIGVAAGYTGSRNALDGRGSSSVETGHLAGYGGWSFGSLNLRAGGAYAWHAIDTSRAIVFPGFFDTATATYNGSTRQIFGEAGHGVALGNVAVEPFAGAAWVDVKTDAAIERGGAAALNVAATGFGLGYSTLGIRAASMIPVGHDMVLVPRASLAWQHAFSSVTPEARLAFVAAPSPFTIAGAPIARDSILGEAGLDLAISRNATVGVSYVGQLARNVQDHAAKGKFSWRF